AVDPQNPNTLFAATRYRGVVKSINGGTSWTQVGFWDVYHFVTSLALDPRNPQTLYAGVIAVGHASGSTLYKSTDAGATWNATTLSLEGAFNSAIAIDAQNPNTVYAAAGGRLWKSIDGAANWSDLSSRLPAPVSTVTVDLRKSGTIYAGTNLVVLTSTD